MADGFGVRDGLDDEDEVILLVDEAETDAVRD